MDGTQALVGLAGVGLVAVNFWTGPDKVLVGNAVTSRQNNANLTPADTAAQHAALVKLGGELLLVVVATVVAGVSGTWSVAILVAFAALWVLWLINRKGGGVQATATPASTGGG